MNQTQIDVREHILDSVDAYYTARSRPAFRPGVDPVPVSGKVYGAEEMQRLVGAALDGWLTAGKECQEFERLLAERCGVRHAVLCNSGSSANLLALASLELESGDEVIVPAVGFPTSLNPVLQLGLVPVFVDVDPVSYNITHDNLLAAIGPKTKAVMAAHVLGNPVDLGPCTKVDHVDPALARLWYIEDACDSLGGTMHGRPLGSFGDVSTLSFYPAHHITTGEGGCVLTDSSKLKKVIESFRDWGRDCWCDPGKDNTCGKRFGWDNRTECGACGGTGTEDGFAPCTLCHDHPEKRGGLPLGYDHKYTYSRVGWNLKMTDLQAAVGVAQMGQLNGFIWARQRNWQRLRDCLFDLQEFLQLPGPTPNSNPSWFRCPLHAGRAGAVPGGPEDRHTPPVRRQPAPAARVPQYPAPGRRPPDQRRLLHRAGLLGGVLSGPYGGNA